MDANQLKLWKAKREQLFPVALSASVLETIDARVKSFDFAHAIEVLSMYREERPYRGFYIARYSFLYHSTISRTAPDRERRFEAPSQDIGQEAEADRRRYASLSDEFLEACRNKYANWGWAEGSRQWQILCIDAHEGKDVSCYQCFPAFGSPGYDRAERIAAAAAARTRADDLSTIEALRAKVLQLGGTVDVYA